VLSVNVTNAQSGWFVNAEKGDLHLISKAATVIDQVTLPAGVIEDIVGYLPSFGENTSNRIGLPKK